MSRFITNKAEEVLAMVMIANLREFADTAEEAGDRETAINLRTIAIRLYNGTATEDEWIEAIEQMAYADRCESLNW